MKTFEKIFETRNRFEPKENRRFSINKITKKEAIDYLPHIGKDGENWKKIESARPLRNAADLYKLKGLGETIIEDLLPLITFNIC